MQSEVRNSIDKYKQETEILNQKMNDLMNKTQESNQ
jgi:hypothetical protein